MLVLVLVAIGLVPPVLSAWLSRRARRRVEAQFELALETAAHQRFQSWVTRDPNAYYVDGMGFVIGDITCRLNARSPYLRCAVNPAGPCEGCRAYEET